MRGYAELRRTLLEIDRRFKLDGGIFFLRHTEILELTNGRDFKPLIAERRRTRAIELSLEVPPVLFGDDLEAIGRPLPTPVGAEELNGVPLSAGVAEGLALVLTEPTATPGEPGYILVCPSTDPAWVPLFVNARGLVMESGGRFRTVRSSLANSACPRWPGFPACSTASRQGSEFAWMVVAGS